MPARRKRTWALAVMTPGHSNAIVDGGGSVHHDCHRAARAGMRMMNDLPPVKRNLVTPESAFRGRRPRRGG